MPCVAIASHYFLQQVCISILTVIFCYSVGALSDLLVTFSFSILHLALCSSVVFCLVIYLIGSVYESVVFSVVFIACGNFDFFFSIYLCYFFNLLNLFLWYPGSLSISLGLIFLDVST